MNQKIKYYYVNNKLGYLLIIMLIGVSSNAFMNVYYRELLFVLTIISSGLMILCKRQFSTIFVIFLLIIAIWLLYIWIYFDVWNTATVVGFYLRFLLGYAIVSVLGEKFFPILLRTIYLLSAISILLYCIGIIFPSLMVALHGILSSSPDLFVVDKGEFQGVIRANFLIYTFSIERLSQNAGFMWEPAAFAVVLLFAMMINFVLNGFKLNRIFWVLFIALITTFSTTGFVCFSIVILFYLINSSLNKKVYILFLMIPLIPAIASMDMISEKIAHEFDRGDEMANTNTEISMAGNSRLSSFIWDIRDWKVNPLLGVGIYEENRHVGFQILNSDNGVSDSLVKYGVIIYSLFLVNAFLSFNMLTVQSKSKGSYLFIILFLLLSWSERFLILPLFLAMTQSYLPLRLIIKSKKFGGNP